MEFPLLQTRARAFPSQGLSAEKSFLRDWIFPISADEFSHFSCLQDSQHKILLASRGLIAFITNTISDYQTLSLLSGSISSLNLFWGVGEKSLSDLNVNS